MSWLATYNFKYFLPQILQASFSIVFIFIGLFYKKNTFSFVSKSYVSLLIASLFFNIILFNEPLQISQSFASINTLTLYANFFIILVSLLISLYMQHATAKTEMERFELPTLFLFISLGAQFVCMANDIIFAFLALELMSLSLYITVGMRSKNPKSQEASVKYVVFGALASALILYGFSLVYVNTGSTNFVTIQETLRFESAQTNLLLCVAFLFIVFGLSFKLTLAPFHIWAPDVYEGSPLIITSIIATIPKIAAIVLLIKMMTGVFETLIPALQLPLLFLAHCTIIVGTFSALRQNDILRFIALSSVGQLGFVFLGLIAMSELAVQGVLFFTVVYVMSTLGVFISLLLLRWSGTSCKILDDLAGLRFKHPRQALILAFFMFTFAGIPPLVGFFAKFSIFTALIGQGFVLSSILAILNMVVSSYYYLRVIKIMYFDNYIQHKKETISFDAKDSFFAKLSLTFCVGTLLILTVFPSLMVSKASQIVRSLNLVFAQ